MCEIVCMFVCLLQKCLIQLKSFAENNMIVISALLRQSTLEVFSLAENQNFLFFLLVLLFFISPYTTVPPVFRVFVLLASFMKSFFLRVFLFSLCFSVTRCFVMNGAVINRGFLQFSLLLCRGGQIAGGSRFAL